MKLRVSGAVLAACVLGGCTSADWDHATSYVGLGGSSATAPAEKSEPAAPPEAPAQPATTPDAPAKAAAAPEAPPPPVNEWCAQVAKAAQTEAADQGFDKPTQQRRAQSAYQQCASSPGVSAD